MALPPWQDPREREAGKAAALRLVQRSRDLVLLADERMQSGANEANMPAAEQLAYTALMQRFLELSIRNAILDPAAISIEDIAGAAGCDVAFVERIGDALDRS